METILVVEDDAQMSAIIQETLKKAGFEVHAASNGLDAMDYFRKTPADLIVMDMLMPAQDGVDTISKLRKDTPDLKIVAISGGGNIGSETYLSMARKVGASRTLSKPFRIADLLEVVNQLLGKA